MKRKHSAPAPGGLSGPTELEVRQITAALQEHADEIDCAYLFGSIARGDEGPLSDLDLALLCSDSLSPEERADLQVALAGQGQSFAGPRIDITILNDAPPLLKHRVIRDGRLVFVKDDKRRVAFETRAILEFLDFQPVLDRCNEALFSRAREGRFGD